MKYQTESDLASAIRTDKGSYKTIAKALTTSKIKIKKTVNDPFVRENAPQRDETFSLDTNVSL